MIKAAINRVKNRFLRPVSKPNAEKYNIITEGKGHILFPEKETVFYNPIQQFNRDLSVTCIKAWDNLYGQTKQEQSRAKKHSKKRGCEEPQDTLKKRKLQDGSCEIAKTVQKPYIKILEALSATGLRAIRYAHEIPHVKEIVANDLLPAAVDAIQRNVDYNNVGDIVKPNIDDANVLMYKNKAQHKRYHVIDLDPYGTVTPFVDAALQNIEDDGLMLVTCTDLSVLAGNGYPEKCFALYGGVNMAGHDATHESALRLVLNLLGQSAAKYRKSIEPVLSLSIDFYVRVFIKVKTNPLQVKNLQHNTMITYMCSGCGAYHNQKLGRQSERETKKGNTYVKYSLAQGPPVDKRCSYCGGAHHLTGPMYAGPLHNKDFIDEVLRINREEHTDEVYKTRKRIEGMLTLAKNELDAPFYFTPNRVSSILKFQVPSLKTVVAGLGSLGYECSLTHAQPSSLKTDAPWEVIWYVMKRYCQDNDLCNIEKMNPNTFGYKILTNDAIVNGSEYDDKLSFEQNEQSAKVEKLRKLKIVRFQENPSRNWGPKARPT
ncbi:LANO_0C06656g1_1 [Lachancea nothofagi CBS 11611]|uniref:tRNA (guanine(26)-N(2))-dimethyltransferase n=1 Tax=Lachancea nothofagi CBS 11611 TaxID=1266666 RepID=A0A1G4J842_9SACH|nr:LANO_0C06656g1_1 [Lachancea nothofagi CBS 11611]